ncbi:MAG: hypothetical protein HQ592_17550 [Planctomycetes bacterium]|nr:hypothetical protein [Planctomycetota bacterium]
MRGFAMWLGTSDWKRALTTARAVSKVEKNVGEQERATTVFRSGIRVLKFLTEELDTAIEARDTRLVILIQEQITKVNLKMKEEEKEIAASFTDDEAPPGAFDASMWPGPPEGSAQDHDAYYRVKALRKEQRAARIGIEAEREANAILDAEEAHENSA